MDFDLNTALAKIPRKGDQHYPFQPRTQRARIQHDPYGRASTPQGKAHWYVEENLHEWAIEQGYLTGAIFKRTKRTNTSYCLLLVGPCPWTPGHLRYYRASL